ncbi:MAG: translation elongation factor EF-1beta [Thermoplasmata archaeon]|nr:translation elongation factor EF-1beta [Thermoplasmata archaeon]MDO5862222.1 translation elongation factor EF-1beta [Thermoplasmata archaeon]
MGQIAAAYDLMPESTEVNLDDVIAKLKDVVPEGVQILETEIKPVAFGLMKVYAGFLIDDSDEEVGGKLENGLRSIAGIENVECVSSTVV